MRQRVTFSRQEEAQRTHCEYLTTSPFDKIILIILTAGPQLQAILIRVQRTLAITAPIRLLPPEVLSLIFELTVSEAAQFPSSDLLAIVQTCQRWRQVAIGTPVLWTCINFFMDERRTKDFLQNNNISRADYLLNWLSRTGRLPLSIAAVGHGVNLSEDVFEAILQQLGRTRRLALLHCSSAYIRRLFGMGSIGINVRQLDLGAGCEEAFNHSTYGSLGALNSGWGVLELPNLDTVFLHSLPADLMLQVRAPNLRHLAFARCWTCPYALRAISQIFPRMTHLKMMSFSLHQHGTHLISVDDGPGVSLLFPELTHFLWLDSRAPGNPHITSVSSENINLPALSRSPKLKYGWIEVRVPTFIKPALLPHLVDLRLKVEIDIHHEVARRLFSGLDLLKSLTIERTRFAQGTTKVEGIVTGLSHSRVDPTTSADVTVHTSDVPPIYSLETPSSPLCPRLERLTISECIVPHHELFRFAYIRRQEGTFPVPNSTKEVIGLQQAVQSSKDTRPSSGRGLVPCRVTLRGCPGLPNMERVSFVKLCNLMSEGMNPAPRTGLLALPERNLTDYVQILEIPRPIAITTTNTNTNTNTQDNVN
jgi:hypothetical protein